MGYGDPCSTGSSLEVEGTEKPVIIKRAYQWWPLHDGIDGKVTLLEGKPTFEQSIDL